VPDMPPTGIRSRRLCRPTGPVDQRPGCQEPDRKVPFPVDRRSSCDVPCTLTRNALLEGVDGRGIAMFRRGKSSWRFSTDANGLLHAALFVRDALDLPVTSEPAIPPPLDGDIPELRDRISAGARIDAAAAWPAWWDTLVRFEVRQDHVAVTL